VPHLCEFYPGICLTTEEKARKNLTQGSRRVTVYNVLQTCAGLPYVTLFGRVKGSRRFEVSYCFHLEDPTVYEEDVALLYVSKCNHGKVPFSGYSRDLWGTKIYR